MVDEISIPRAS